MAALSQEPSLVRHPIGILPHHRAKHAMRFTALRKRLSLDQLSYGADGCIIAGTTHAANSPIARLEFRSLGITL